MIDYDGIAPGVTFTESEEMDLGLGEISSAIGIVGVAPKGPTIPTLVTSPAQLRKLFGEPECYDTALYGAIVCLGYNKEVYFKRVISNQGAEAKAENSVLSFKTKDKTSLYNGAEIRFSMNEEENLELSLFIDDVEVEYFDCAKEVSDPDFITNIVNKYSEYLSVELVDESIEEITEETMSFETLVLDGGNSGMTWNAEVESTMEEVENPETGETDTVIKETETVSATDAEIADVVEAIKSFKDPELIDFATLIVPGYCDVRVYKAAEEVIDYRRDIVYFPSIPKGLTPNRVAQYVRKIGVGNTSGYRFNSSYVAWFWPNGTVYNQATGKDEVVDITPYVAATYGRSDALPNSEMWYAAAGIVRGLVPVLTGLEYTTNKEERGMLYDSKINVNSVVNVRGQGIAIMGARTSRVYKTTSTNKSLRYISVRRLCNYIRKVVLRDSMYNLFDPNDSYTWNAWILRIDPTLRSIKERRGCYDYQIIMDETTTTQEDINNGISNGIIKIAPEKPMEYINVSFVIAKDGTTSFKNEDE